MILFLESGCPHLEIENGMWTDCQFEGGKIKSCLLQCDDGYVMTGESMINCQADDVWTVGGVCEGLLFFF